MAGFRANTRNEIRRAQTEGVLCGVADNFDRFLALYDQMSAWTALPPTAAGYLRSLGKHLYITEAVFADEVLCSHLYVADASIGRARLIRSQQLPCAHGTKMAANFTFTRIRSGASRANCASPSSFLARCSAWG
jgi:hypothetical protein